MYQGTLRQRLKPLLPTLGVPGAYLIYYFIRGRNLPRHEYEGFADWFGHSGWIVLVVIIAFAVLIRWGKHFVPKRFHPSPQGPVSPSREAAINRANGILARLLESPSSTSSSPPRDFVCLCCQVNYSFEVVFLMVFSGKQTQKDLFFLQRPN